MLSLRLKTLGTPSFGEQRDPECVRVCVLKGGRLNSYTEEEAPRFPYLTTAERASPGLRAGLFHVPGARVRSITYVPAVPLHRPHDSAVPSTFTSFFFTCTFCPSVHPSPSFQPSHLRFEPAVYLFISFFQISIHQHVTARVCHVLIERRMGERERDAGEGK